MNTQRFVWAATTILFALVGALLGYATGRFYLALPKEVIGVNNLSFVAPTLSVGMAIVAARVGSWIADRYLLPALRGLANFSAADRVLGVVGALLGVLFGVLVTSPISDQMVPHTLGLLGIKFSVMVVCAALGMAIFGGMRSEMLRVFPQLEEGRPSPTGGRPKFLDTNIIIDGRLADLCQTGFIEGPIYVPQFVLEEVQHVADSSDSIRRARGRRGLDVLNAMKEMTTPQIVNGQTVLVPVVHVLNEISPEVQKIHAVDSKLVVIAREHNGVIITNDFNLNKVAELQGVTVLNLNELAQAMKPVVLPGEEMQVAIVKEGKEHGQGIGYLEDGTMVVVGDGAAAMGETAIVTISSVYQTVAGKMIFAELKDKEAPHPPKPQIKGSGDDLFDDNSARGGRSGDDYNHRSGGGVRRKGRA